MQTRPGTAFVDRTRRIALTSAAELRRTEPHRRFDTDRQICDVRTHA